MKLNPESKEQLSEQVIDVLANLDNSSFGRYYDLNQSHAFEELGYSLLDHSLECSTEIINEIIQKISVLFNEITYKDKSSESNVVKTLELDLESAVKSLNTIKTSYVKDEELISLKEENEALRASQKALKEELNKVKLERQNPDPYHGYTYS